MNNKPPAPATITFLLGIFSGLALGVFVIPPLESKSEPTCEEMYEFNWSFQQCLKYQFRCKTDIDQAAFGQYHKNRHVLNALCDDQPGTVLPDSITLDKSK